MVLAWPGLVWGTLRRLGGALRSSRALSWLVTWLFTVDLFFIVLYVVVRAMRMAHSSPGFLGAREWRITEERGYPEIFNYLQTLLVVAGNIRLARLTRQLVYVTLAVVFTVVVLDDALGLHEWGGEQLVRLFSIERTPWLRAQDIGEVLAWGIIGLIVAPLVLAGLRRSSREHTACGIALLLPFAALVVFAVGVDQLYARLHHISRWVGVIVDAVEDGGELLSITLAATLVLAANRLFAGRDPTGAPRSIR